MLFYTILGLDWANSNVFWPFLMVLRQFLGYLEAILKVLRQYLVILDSIKNLGSASAVTQWLPTLKQAYLNVI